MWGLQLLRYAVSDRNSVSSSAYEGIYEHRLAMAAGVWGFILSGIAYDKRRGHEQGPIY